MTENLTKLARKLRRNQTRAEEKLWSRLRKKNLLAVKFRRQQPIGDYIVDFLSFDPKLVIEVDGGQHAEDPQDAERDKWLRGEGFTVLRFWNNEVLKETEAVMREIVQAIKEGRE